MRMPAYCRSNVCMGATRLPYKHGFHAGNTADVLKHSMLCLLLQHMLMKDKPFTYVDTHAGAGMYRLDGDESSTLREHDIGIGLLRRAALEGQAMPDAIGALLRIAQDERCYPGSPSIAASLCRPCDSLFLCERAADQHALLLQAMGDDARVTALQADGYTATRDRRQCEHVGRSRALILVDPPYQFGSDTEQIARLVAQLSTHWRSARLAIWYPITRDAAKVTRLHSAVKEAANGECLVAELRTTSQVDDGQMLGSGVLLVQPPYGIRAQLEDELLPALCRLLHVPGGGGSDLDSVAHGDSNGRVLRGTVTLLA